MRSPSKIIHKSFDALSYRTTKVLIPEFVKQNFFLLLFYNAFKMTTLNLRTLCSRILLVIYAFTFLFTQLLPVLGSISFIFKGLSLLTFFYFIIYPFFIALEESLHMGICIQLGKSSFIEKLVVTYFVTQKGYCIEMLSVATKFRGYFKLPERMQIHGGAPLIILLFLNLMLFILLSIKMTNLHDFSKLIF